MKCWPHTNIKISYPLSLHKSFCLHRRSLLFLSLKSGMATAYAALTSVMNIIDTIRSHPRPPISLHQQQIQSLTENISFLQQFLEAGYTNQVSYSSEPDPLEMLIADAAHAAEDVIESHIVDQILADGERVSSVDFYESLQKVIDEMEAVKKKAMAVKEKMKIHKPQIREADSSTSAASSSFSGLEQNNTMVGFDDVLIQVLDKLTSHKSSRQIVSLTGMGGMGKSTLANNVYQHQLVVENFDIRSFVTISQQYNITKVLSKLLEGCGEKLSRVDDYEIGERLHKRLTGRRYLIVIDDIWNIEAWDHLRLFLPDNNIRSRVLITTRLSNLARQIDDSHNIEMPILDQDCSWELFCKHVFKGDACPLELQGIGRQIVEGCKGHPLSISVVGGILANSKPSKEYWEEIAQNLNSTVNLENDKHCLQILYMSYYNLPVHLKPYFLLLGLLLIANREDKPLSLYLELSIGEGFVKPISGKSLEEVALECVNELVERNLILIDRTEDHLSDLMKRRCEMHDLLKDLCLRESEKQKFAYVVGEGSIKNIPHNIDSIRRIFVAENTPEEEVFPFLESASLLRCLWWMTEDQIPLSSICSPLLRGVVAGGVTHPEDLVNKVNLRIIIIIELDRLPSMSRFWDLQTLWVYDDISLNEIWMMSQLKSVVTEFWLPDPPCGELDCSMVLENLHTLMEVENFECSEEVVKRIPHIKTLSTCYTEVEGSFDVDYSLNNLGQLQRLQHLAIQVEMRGNTMQNGNCNITFPCSLTYLSLEGTSLLWDDVTNKIGSLPHLQILQLRWNALYDLDNLKEIPSSIGDITTLERIKLHGCCDSLEFSAQRIKEEQEELGNEDLEQSVEGLILYGMLTPHWPGSPAALPRLTPGYDFARDFRHPHTLCRSGVVFAAEYRPFTPPQQLPNGPFPVT